MFVQERLRFEQRFLLAGFGKRDAGGQQCRAHFRFARIARAAAQRAQARARLAARARTQQWRPRPEYGIEPARGHAQVVYGFVIGAFPATLGGVLEREGAARERVWRRERSGRHRSIAETWRFSASNCETRVQSSFEMSSTLRRASMVWK